MGTYIRRNQITLMLCTTIQANIFLRRMCIPLLPCSPLAFATVPYVIVTKAREKPLLQYRNREKPGNEYSGDQNGNETGDQLQLV